ncbi:MAG TPA: tetratricopeptide repeat protein [Edaphobacter sp.]|nr:tetratricopeptide repeat protein [Edaphobacter sp.]
MGLPIRAFRLAFLPLLILFFASAAGTALYAQDIHSHEEGLKIEHTDPQWLSIQDHLPNPATASPKQLETAADVLRARRFPESALDFYTAAVKRGGDEATLLNKIGVTELELGNQRIAEEFFRRVVHLKKKDADAWNNLGAVEYLRGENGHAISDYKKAIKLNKKSAAFHSNLGTAFFQTKEYDRARKEFQVALKLDPDLMMHRGGPGGITMRMLSPQDHARFCYELARLYAQNGDITDMLHYLTTASEGGFDVLHQMESDPVLGRFRKDPRVLLVVQNAQALRAGHVALADSRVEPPPLPAALHQ